MRCELARSAHVQVPEEIMAMTRPSCQLDWIDDESALMITGCELLRQLSCSNMHAAPRIHMYTCSHIKEHVILTKYIVH